MYVSFDLTKKLNPLSLILTSKRVSRPCVFQGLMLVMTLSMVVRILTPAPVGYSVFSCTIDR